MKNPIVKVALPEKTTESTDIRDYAFISSNTCNKLDSIKNGVIDINAGEISGSVTVTHDLGYPCEFEVYQFNGTSYELWPKDIDAYVTESGITITKKLITPHNQIIYNQNQYVYYYFSPGSEGVMAGQVLGSGYDSAFWIQNMYIPQGQTIVSANMDFTNVMTIGSSNVTFRIYGIDEDNTADLGGGYPGGSPNTDSYRQKSQSQVSGKFNFGDDLTSIVQEIVNRGGWSSGNHMAFKIQNDGSPNNTAIVFDRNGDGSFVDSQISLRVILPGTLTTNYKVVVYKDKIA